MKDYYEILEIDKDATEEEIKKAHRKLVKKYHPDIYHGEDRDEKFKEVQKAYDILSDEQKRREYDSLGREKYEQRDKYSQGYSYKDMNGFNDFRQYSGAKMKSFGDLKWYTKILLIIIGILLIGVFILIAIIGLIIWVIRMIFQLIFGSNKN